MGLSNRQRAVFLLLLAATAVSRFTFSFVLHPAAAHVYSDMYGYVEWSQRIYIPGRQTIFDTFHPPGTPLLFGALYGWDPSWRLAYGVQAALATLSVVLVYDIARRLYGATTGLVSMAYATLYYPFTHYAGFFLAENPFLFCLLLSFWCFVLALAAARGQGVFWAGVGSGCACGLAASFKNAVLGPLAVLAVGYGWYAYRSPELRRRVAILAAGAALGLGTVFVPMTLRCTRLNEGRFCPAATNTALNIVMGHYGHVGMFRWEDRVRNIFFNSQSPTSYLHGYTQEVRFDFGAYDTAKNLEAAGAWMREHPWEWLVLSVQNVWDLFAMRTIWPSGQLGGIDWGAVSQVSFWLAILLPALLYCVHVWRRGAPLGRELVLMLPLAGMMLTVFLSVAEVRYRIPFDSLLIILAAEGCRIFAASRAAAKDQHAV